MPTQPDIPEQMAREVMKLHADPALNDSWMLPADLEQRIADAIEAAERRGAAREREACAVAAANAAAIEGHVWHSLDARQAEQLGAAVADAIRARSEKGEGRE